LQSIAHEAGRVLTLKSHHKNGLILTLNWCEIHFDAIQQLR
jgi:hypothetical protein